MANLRGELTFGTSPAIRRVLDDCADLASSDYPILLTGETGTGKTWLARHIHLLSGRRGLFIESPIPQLEELTQGQLCGYERGAFTDAKEARSGYIEQASHGTLFLDEVGTASPRLQAMLLTVVEAGEIWRIGASRPIPVDVRMVFAMNDLSDGSPALPGLRKDLLFRIATLTIPLPPLRERADDIPDLAHGLLGRIAARHRRECPTLTSRALARLQAAPWPGNLRELDAVLARAFLRLRGRTTIDAGQIEFTPGPSATSRPAELTRDVVWYALAASKGNLARAARQLDAKERTFRRKVAQLLGPRSEWHLELPRPGHGRDVTGPHLPEGDGGDFRVAS